jgi:phage recombination protein Bet
MTIQIRNLFNDEKINLIKKTVCKGATDSELELFLHACQRTGLDPLIKQIYGIKRRNRNASGSYDETMTIQTSIDGYRLIADRTGKYAPGREPTFQYKEDGSILCATAYVKKMTTDGSWHEVAATAFWDEYVQKNYNSVKKIFEPSKFWQQMPHGQLAKCAESLALRKAFPGDFSGIYTHEEMAQASNPEISSDEAIEVISQEIKNEDQIIDDYLNEITKDEEKLSLMRRFIEIYCKHWNITFSKMLIKYENKSAFLRSFDLWNERRLNQAA